MYYRIGDKMEIEELKNRMENIDYNIVNINTEKYSMLLLTSKDNLLTNTAFNIIKKIGYKFIGVKINENKKTEAIFIKNL